MTNSVIYVGTGTGPGFKERGTAFVVAYPVEGWEPGQRPPQKLSTWNDLPHEFYVVTARHIIDGIGQIVGHEKVTLRINDESGGFVEPYPESAIEDWTRLVDSEEGYFRDVAVLPIERKDSYQMTEVSIGRAALAPRREHAEIGIGSDLFYPGLFSRKPGETRNLPIVRAGTLAALAEDDEPVTGKDSFGANHEIVAHLIESRSLEGLSGSPVFVHWPGTRQRTQYGQTVVEAVSQNEFYLLGLVSGHWDETPRDDETATPSDAQEREWDRINVGIGYVTPVEDILAALDEPQHKKHRAALSKEWHESREERGIKRAVVMDVLDTSSSYGGTDMHSDLTKGTRRLDDQHNHEE